MITNGAVKFDIELRRNAVFTLTYDMLEDDVVVDQSGKTHTLVIRTATDDVVVLSKDVTPDVDDNFIHEVTTTEIADLPNKVLDFYIVETPGDIMIGYGDVKVVK